jgi:ABC-type uncharacterized transport system substrate-binding protein
MPEIGFLVATDVTSWDKYIKAFEQRLTKLGWKIIKNPATKPNEIHIDYQPANGISNYYESIATTFVTNQVDVIVTSGTDPALACKEATKLVPIPVVYAAVGDPEIERHIVRCELQ